MVSLAVQQSQLSDEARMLLDALVRGGAMTPYQAQLLKKDWPYLREDWRSNLFLLSVREHSCALIERQRQLDLARKAKEIA